MLLLMGWKDPQEELNLNSKLREFFSSTHPKFAHGWQISPFHQVFGQFSAQSAEWCMCNSSEQPAGHIASKSLLLMALFMPIYSKDVCFLTSKWFCACTQVAMIKWLAPYNKSAPRNFILSIGPSWLGASGHPRITLSESSKMGR